MEVEDMYSCNTEPMELEEAVVSLSPSLPVTRLIF